MGGVDPANILSVFRSSSVQMHDTVCREGVKRKSQIIYKIKDLRESGLEIRSLYPNW